MKAHKYWGIASSVCMLLSVCSGFKMKSKKAHKYFAIGAAGCMTMAMISGFKMVHKPKKKIEGK